MMKFLKNIFNVKEYVGQRKGKIIFFITVLVGILLIIWASNTLKGIGQTSIILLGAFFVLWSIINSWKENIERTTKESVQYQDLKKKFEKQEKEIEQQKRKYELLENRLEEEKEKRIQVSNIKPILNLGILEADCEIIRFFKKYFDSKGEESSEELCKGHHFVRYLGVLKIKFTAIYSIDMQNIRVKMDRANKTIYVSGAEAKFSSMRNYDSDWKLSEGYRPSTWNPKLWVQEESSESINETRKLEKSLYKETQEEIKKGPEELKWIKKPLETHVQNILRFFIIPWDKEQEYQIQPIEQIGTDGESLFDFIQRIEFKELSARKENNIAEVQ